MAVIIGMSIGLSCAAAFELAKRAYELFWKKNV